MKGDEGALTSLLVKILTTAGITFCAARLKPSLGKSPLLFTLFSYSVTTPLRATLGEAAEIWRHTQK